MFQIHTCDHDPGHWSVSLSYSLSPNISASALLESKMIIKAFLVLFPTHFLELLRGEGRQIAGNRRQRQEGKGWGFPQAS